MNRSVDLWVVDRRSLVNLDSVKARDIMVECFVHAQSEAIVRAKTRMGVATDEPKVRRTIELHVRSAFTAVGGDFDAPTPDVLRAVVVRLGAQSSAMGMPKDIVEHHSAQILRVIDSVG